MSETPKRPASPQHPAPKIEHLREEASSRTTLDVDPAWLEANRPSLDRASLDRRTIDVEPDWLERDSKPAVAEASPRAAVPPPLPKPEEDDEPAENEPVRSAIPPPLPK